MVHCVAYIRQSSEEAAKRDLSCPAQEQRFLADVQQRQTAGDAITYEIAPWDEGKSGGEIDRPGLQWILANLDRFQELWVYDHDRLVRHAFFGPYLMHELRGRGIRLWVSQGGSDDATPMARFMTDMRMRFGAYYREEIGETAKRTRDFRLKEGLWSGHAPTGYKYVFEAGDHSRRILVPDPEKAPQVQALFRLMADGVSQKKACQQLDVNQSTVVWQRDNPLYIGLVYKIRDNLRALDDRSYQTLWNLATDPKVIWLYVGRHEPLVDQDVWDKLERRRRVTSRARVSPRMTLSGVFRCETCGGSLRIRSNHGWPTLRCERCAWEKSYRHAEATVLAALALVRDSPDFERDVETELKKPEPRDETVLDALLMERSTVIRKLENALDALIDTDELTGDLRARAIQLKRRKEALDKEITREQARMASAPTIMRSWRETKAMVSVTPISELWAEASPPEQRELVHRVFGLVRANPEGCTFAVQGLGVGFTLDWQRHYTACEEATTGIEPV